MNDRQDPYAHDLYAQQQPQVYGYDAYGRPVYRPDAPERVYDAYGQPLQQAQPQQHQPQSYGYDPYAQPVQQQPYDPYQAQQHVQQQARQQHVQQQPVQQAQQEWIPRQSGPPAPEEPQEPQEPAAAPAAEKIPEPRPAPDYRTEQFSFIEEPDEDSEDVIDWLKFSESRTERRDERKRKGRNRVIALVVVLVLAVGAAVGWFLLSDAGSKKGTGASGGARQRDVIVVHLKETKGSGSSTALLVDNAGSKRGTTVLLPNSLVVSKDGGGATTLGKSVQDAGTGGTRDALNTLLGGSIKGSWRLDTPYLENLVQLVGGITVDADTTVPGASSGDRPVVSQGTGQSLNGQAAVAYATYRADGEDPNRQLARFGQVMQGVLKKISTDPDAATTTVESLAQIPDPSLSVKQLGASLAGLAARARAGAYDTRLLPVQPDGTLADKSAGMVKDVLGGTVKNADKNAAARVSVKDATGGKSGAAAAQVALANGGYTYVDGGRAGAAEAASSVTYTDDLRAGEAKEVAKTLGLPDSAVKKGGSAGTADIAVVLGKDYKGGS
ncbi:MULTISPECIES: LCP family protein [Streptomyces]|uniref:LCP family protein n=1 Tax=Streptomyces morookaense TaxID=1970 RepID=A0A7Y7BBE4_STRMO|nr:MULTISPECIES: LCP family protein [Streptomyces]MCC2275333.1 LCP family protein [Streptomyces sp. ET3-23]NVK82390.1 LCP family protein [Streptomyces morookaense]GHF42507.1 membrane protein [Streptomyces morookaense]